MCDTPIAQPSAKQLHQRFVNDKRVADCRCRLSNDLRTVGRHTWFVQPTVADFIRAAGGPAGVITMTDVIGHMQHILTANVAVMGRREKIADTQFLGRNPLGFLAQTQAIARTMLVHGLRPDHQHLMVACHAQVVEPQLAH